MIDHALAGFLEEGLGVYVGTRNASLEPNGARGVAVLVEPGGTHLTVYVAATGAQRLLPDLDANGHLAVSVGRPKDDRACQVKGVFTGARTAGDDERERVVAQWERF